MQTAIGEFIGNQVIGYFRFRIRCKGRSATGRFLNKICSAIDEKISPVKKYIPSWVIAGGSFMAAQEIGRYTYKAVYSTVEKTVIKQIKNDLLHNGTVSKGLLALSSVVVTQPVVPCLLAGGSVLLVGSVAIACMIKHRTVSN